VDQTVQAHLQGTAAKCDIVTGLSYIKRACHGHSESTCHHGVSSIDCRSRPIFGVDIEDSRVLWFSKASFYLDSQLAGTLIYIKMPYFRIAVPSFETSRAAAAVDAPGRYQSQTLPLIFRPGLENFVNFIKFRCPLKNEPQIIAFEARRPFPSRNCIRVVSPIHKELGSKRVR
jgi:hypothetical protein